MVVIYSVVQMYLNFKSDYYANYPRRAVAEAQIISFFDNS